VSFALLRERLLDRLRRLVSNGAFTERGLARFLGISQPHAHNVLSGVRQLTPELFDAVLVRLRIDVLDLYKQQEIVAHADAANTRERRKWAEVPLLSSPIGPANPWPWPLRAAGSCRVPIEAASGRIAAPLAPDPAMRRTLSPHALAVLDTRTQCLAVIDPCELYVVAAPSGSLVRRVREGAACLYLVDDLCPHMPLRWSPAPRNADVNRARVVWLGAAEV
jgi:hypothetical protein